MRKKLDMKRRLLAEAEKDSLISSVNNRVRELNLEIDTLLDKENRMWLQRGNYCVLPEYHKCVLPPLTLMVGPTN